MGYEEMAADGGFGRVGSDENSRMARELEEADIREYMERREREAQEEEYHEWLQHPMSRASERAREEAETTLRCWREAFGTSQLTHAKARLEAAESKAARVEEAQKAYGKLFNENAALQGRAEEAEARLRVAGEAWPKIRDSIHANCHNKSVWDAVRDMKEALDGDLPPCPECAKANAKLAAVGREIDDLMSDVDDYDEDDLYAEGFANSTKSIAKMIRNELASDPEVVAVVESNIFMGSPGVTTDSGIVISRPQGNMIHVDIGKTGKVGDPVTVAVTRRGAGE